MNPKSRWTMSLLVLAACSSNGNAAHELAATDGGTKLGRDAGTEASACPTGSYEGGVPSGAWGPGDYPPEITAQTWLPITGVSGQQGLTRQYKVHIPPGYSTSASVPIVFCFHGLSQDGVAFCTDSGVAWNTKSDQEGFILFIPNGYNQSWNVGSCCGPSAALIASS